VTINKGLLGISGLAWSPIGNRIAVRMGEQLAILTLRQKASSSAYTVDEQQDIALHGLSFNGLSWSPDGRAVAYETSWQDGSRIWLTEQDGSVQSALHK
jgi:Tol biopolymer transport system component